MTTPILPPRNADSARLMWSLNVDGNRLDVLTTESSSITVDRLKAPQIMATVHVKQPPVGPIRTALTPFRKTPVTLRTEHYPYWTEPLDSLDTKLTGSNLGAVNWTLPATDQHRYAPGYTIYDDTAPAAKDVTLFIREVETDNRTGVVRVELASFEALLIDKINLGGDFLPMLTSPQGLSLQSATQQVFRHAGVPNLVDKGLSQVVAPYVRDYGPWQRGETAWTYIQKLASSVGWKYIIDGTTGALRWVGGLPSLTTYSDDPDAARHITTANLGIGSDDTPYADAYQIRWRFEDANGNVIESIDTALAPGVATWRDAVKPFFEDREGVMTAPGLAGFRLAQARMFRSASLRSYSVLNLALNPYMYGGFTDHYNTNFGPFANALSLTFTYPDGQVTVENLET